MTESYVRLARAQNDPVDKPEPAPGDKAICPVDKHVHSPVDDTQSEACVGVNSQLERFERRYGPCGDKNFGVSIRRYRAGVVVPAGNQTPIPDIQAGTDEIERAAIRDEGYDPDDPPWWPLDRARARLVVLNNGSGVGATRRATLTKLSAMNLVSGVRFSACIGWVSKVVGTVL
ncbi:hypothetical protein [Mycobacterium avium]|uniref:hypothetical protein n=1 Tax=Mycobacterium avium TaxID=1764 RepID=UPI00111C1E52|nr:hypothetical protein [Mycobacterium avium]